MKGINSNKISRLIEPLAILALVVAALHAHSFAVLPLAQPDSARPQSEISIAEIAFREENFKKALKHFSIYLNETKNQVHDEKSFLKGHVEYFWSAIKR